MGFLFEVFTEPTGQYFVMLTPYAFFTNLSWLQEKSKPKAIPKNLDFLRWTPEDKYRLDRRFYGFLHD